MMRREIEDIRLRQVQALHAGISRRDWHATEVAANQLRDRIDAAIAAMPVPSQEVERLRGALLDRVRYDNDCLCHVSDPDCTGWDADRCGCAIEARAELKGADNDR